MLKKRHLFQWPEFDRGSRRLLLAIFLGVLTVISLISDHLGLHTNRSLIPSHHTVSKQQLKITTDDN